MSLSTQWMEYAKEIRAQANSSVPMSDFIVGSEGFIGMVLSKLKKKTLQVQLDGISERPKHQPPIDALIDLICEVLDIDRLEFDERPKRKGPRRARQLLTRIWVRHYRGTQLALARHLHVSQAMVSRWYSRALEDADVLYDWYSEIVERLSEVEIWRVPVTDEPIPQRHDPRRVTVNVELEG